jgi:hypothetical protein
MRRWMTCACTSSSLRPVTDGFSGDSHDETMDTTESDHMSTKNLQVLVGWQPCHS